MDIIEESQVLQVAKLIAHSGKDVTIKDRGSLVSLVKRTFGRLFTYEVEVDHIPNTDMGNPLSSYTK